MISWVNGWKYENLLQFNTSWLASLRMWYLYFKLCFSSSCSDYDLTLIKKWRTLNCYSFLQNFYWKQKLENSLLVTVVAQFTAKTINSGKTIYFFSFKSCSINKHMSYVIHMQKQYFFGFTWKKMFAQENGRGRGGVWRTPCPPAFFLRPWTFVLYLTVVFSFLSKSYCIAGTLAIPFRFYSIS